MIINLLTAQPAPTEIRAARLAAGLTQTQAADLIGYSLRGWQQIESGQSPVQVAAWALFLLSVRQHKGFEIKTI
jgi:putative transcriptional regulator